MEKMVKVEISLPSFKFFPSEALQLVLLVQKTRKEAYRVALPVLAVREKREGKEKD